MEVAKNYSVLSISMDIEHRIIKSIHFSHDKSKYIARVFPDSIELYTEAYVPIVEFDMNTKNVWWYLNHRCKPEISDSNNVVICYACDDSKLKDNFWNRGILRSEGREYSKELLNVLKDVPAYMLRFYNFCKE
jgi:hypothetical protein